MHPHLRLSFERIAVNVGSVIPKVSQSGFRCFTRPLARSLPRWPELFGFCPPALPSNQRALQRPVASHYPTHTKTYFCTPTPVFLLLSSSSFTTISSIF